MEWEINNSVPLGQLEVHKCLYAVDSLITYLFSYICSCSDIVRQSVFNISTANLQLKGESSTIGLDAFISSDRIIWLDCQPLLSAAVAERELSSNSKYNCFLKDFSIFVNDPYVSR